MDSISRVVGRVQEIQARLNIPTQSGAFAELLDAAQPATPSPMDRGRHASPGFESLGTVFGLNGPIPVAHATPESVDAYLEVHGLSDRNGRLEADELVEVSGGWHGTARLLPPAAQAWESMRSAAAQDGVDLYAVDSYRSYEVQAHAHGEYLAGRKSAYVAPPGESEHGFGLAVDVSNGSPVGPGDPEWQWLSENATRFGWHPISNESWHWEYRG
jgi:D-alanyl-D-alanine carboxypeptidase